MVIASQNSYDNFEFYKAVTILNRWANLEFSAFYMEAIKDRLYTLGENSLSRRAAQTTLFYILTHLQEVLGPITPLLVEETWEHTPETIKSHSGHPLQRIAASPATQWQDPALETSYKEITAVHAVIKSLQEEARSKKQLGSSLQSFVHISLPREGTTIFQQYLSELPDLFVVSSVTISKFDEPVPTDIAEAEWQYQQTCSPNGHEGMVYVYAPQASKCPRCWRYAVPETEETDKICDRCEDVVAKLDV
ncbi:Isoleucine-tRNA ligase type 1 [Penicillium hetheringtonii]|nr:Isoleucine-tRNA ligase type 1 [Penicillium hetheringtonii]